MKDKFTKAEIIDNLHEKLGMDKSEIHLIIDSFFEEVKDGLKKGQIAEFRGFGTFEIRIRKGKERARNPKTGDIVSVDDHGVVAFRAGRELKKELWELRK